MTKAKIRTFRDRLNEDQKDPEFKKLFEEEKKAIALAMQIVDLRERLGISQTELAKRMGTSQQAISRLESGEYDGFTLKTLERIAHATGAMLKIEFVLTG